MQHVGIVAYRRPWEATFASFEGRIGYQVSDLHIITAAEVAFSHSLNQMSRTTTSEQTTSMWVRWTACFRKLDGRWLITHEQVSVPSCRIGWSTAPRGRPAPRLQGTAAGGGTSACSGPGASSRSSAAA